MPEKFDVAVQRVLGLIGFFVLMRRTWRVKLGVIRTSRTSGRTGDRAVRRALSRSFVLGGLAETGAS